MIITALANTKSRFLRKNQKTDGRRRENARGNDGAKKRASTDIYGQKYHDGNIRDRICTNCASTAYILGGKFDKCHEMLYESRVEWNSRPIQSVCVFLSAFYRVTFGFLLVHFYIWKVLGGKTFVGWYCKSLFNYGLSDDISKETNVYWFIYAYMEVTSSK